MTLLDSKAFIKKFIKPGLIILISVFLGCETANDVGIQYPLDTNIKVDFVEFTLPSANVYIDSLRTDNESFISVGNYTDSFTGSVSAESYFLLSYIPGTIPGNVILSNFEYDSVRISLGGVGSLINSDVANHPLVIGELENTLIPGVTYLASTKMDTSRQIGVASFLVENTSDTIFSNTQLSDDFGNDLFSIGSNASSLFSAEFPSLAIFPGDNNELISSILTSIDTTSIYMYVTNPEGLTEIISGDTVKSPVTYQAEFAISEVNYTHLKRDASASLFSGISENSNFSLSNGLTVIDPLMGLSTTFNVDELTDFFDQKENIIINSAVIFIEIEGNNMRDTLENFATYLRKPDKSFFASASSSVQSIFSNTIVSDESFFGSSIVSSVSRFNENLTSGNQESVSIGCTRFFTSVYNEYVDFGVLQFISPFEENPKPISEFVIIDQSDFNFRRTVFKENGVKLRVYFTEVED